MTDADLEARRRALVGAKAARRPPLELRLLRQQAHFTTPAGDAAMIEKAVAGPVGAVPRILERLGIATGALAEALAVPEADVLAVLGGPKKAPLVVVDGEDAQALREDTVRRGRANAIRAFRDLEWGGTLRFWRPSGIELEFSTGDVLEVLLGAGEGRAPGAYPIDGVVWPKVERPEEVRWLLDALGVVEAKLGLAAGRIKVALLIESGEGLLSLRDLTEAAGARLAALVFGIADFAADVGLPTFGNDHPAADAARSAIVAAAGAAGVPAIDAMTFAYPVPSKELGPDENRRRVLERLVEVHRDAVHGLELGMAGKWVGHPAQLAMVLLAHRRALGPELVARELERVLAYRRAVEAERGATTIGGDMADRATDRHARTRLRRAVAAGTLDPARAHEAGVIDSAELRAWASL